MDAALYYCVKSCRFPEPYLNFRLTACTTSRYFQYFPPDCVFSGLRLMFSLWISLYPLNMTWFLNSSLWHSCIKTVFRSKLDVQKSSAISSINIFNPARKNVRLTLLTPPVGPSSCLTRVYPRGFESFLFSTSGTEKCVRQHPQKGLCILTGADSWPRVGFLASCVHSFAYRMLGEDNRATHQTDGGRLFLLRDSDNHRLGEGRRGAEPRRIQYVNIV